MLRKRGSALVVLLLTGKRCTPGGDFGGMVAYVLGALHPEHCAAVHSNITVCLPSMTNPWTMLQVRPTLMAVCPQSRLLMGMPQLHLCALNTL